MKVKVPPREISVCDFCNREGYLQKCWCCEREFCLSCQATIPQSYGFTQVCRICREKKPEVRKICDRFETMDRDLIHFTIYTADGLKSLLADENEFVGWMPLHAKPGPIEVPSEYGNRCHPEEVPVPAWLRMWRGPMRHRWFIAVSSRRLPMQLTMEGTP